MHILYHVTVFYTEVYNWKLKCITCCNPFKCFVNVVAQDLIPCSACKD